MDRTIILCIALIICTALAYFAGRADEKRKIQKEIAKLEKASCNSAVHTKEGQ